MSNHAAKMSSNTRLNSKKCDQCDYSTTFATTLKRHIRTHRGQKLHKCDLCGHLFHQAGNLKRHMLIHNGEKPHKCHYCNYSCSETGDLKKHMRTHSGDKPYKCDQCDYASATASHLRRHKKTHKNPKKGAKLMNSCLTPDILKQHTKEIHSRQKKYTCELCRYVCVQSGTLQRHLKTHKGDKNFKCVQCGRYYSRAEHLVRHTKRCTEVLDKLLTKLQHPNL